MQRPSVRESHPITSDDHDFIDRVVGYVGRKKLSKLRKSRIMFKERQNRINYSIQSFASDLKELHRHPQELTIAEKCYILSELKNIDRLLLLKARPTLIQDGYDVIALLKYIDDHHDRLFLAYALLDRLIHYDEEVMIQNLKAVTNMLHFKQRKQFYEFADSKLTELAIIKFNAIEDTALSATVFFTALNVIAYITDTSPTFKAITITSAIVSAAGLFTNQHKEGSLLLRLWHTYSIWRKTLTSLNIHQCSPKAYK